MSMVEFAEQGAESPDIGFALTSAIAPTDPALALIEAIGEPGPVGWQRFTASFAITVVAAVGSVSYFDPEERHTSIDASAAILEAARGLRERSVGEERGPWWRVAVTADVAGGYEVDYDHGDEPFPPEHLFTPEAYLFDLHTYPRSRVPVWLSAYVFHNTWQLRSARAAADAAERPAVSVPDEFPPLGVFFARWATIAAAFVAVGSEYGPRILPALGVFEGAGRSGSTLHVLPGRRAVLSGGVWNAPELDAAYNDGTPYPDLYAGAPAWVTDQVLNPRASTGLLSFCYWWDGGSWYRGQSPGAAAVSAAVPGVWTAADVAEVMCAVAYPDAAQPPRAAMLDVIAAAEAGTVTRELVERCFADPGHDVAGAFAELSMAGPISM